MLTMTGTTTTIPDPGCLAGTVNIRDYALNKGGGGRYPEAVSRGWHLPLPPALTPTGTLVGPSLFGRLDLKCPADRLVEWQV